MNERSFIFDGAKKTALDAVYILAICIGMVSQKAKGFRWQNNMSMWGRHNRLVTRPIIVASIGRHVSRQCCAPSPSPILAPVAASESGHHAP